MTALYLPEPADERIESLVASNPDYEIRGWCLYCGSDRLMVNAISKPCRGCGAEFGLVSGPESSRPPRPVEVPSGDPITSAYQQTLFTEEVA